jgi:hypothetical protein
MTSIQSGLSALIDCPLYWALSFGGSTDTGISVLSGLCFPVFDSMSLHHDLLGGELRSADTGKQRADQISTLAELNPVTMTWDSLSMP